MEDIAKTTFCTEIVFLRLWGCILSIFWCWGRHPEAKCCSRILFLHRKYCNNNISTDRFLKIVGLNLVDFLVLGRPSGNKILLPDTFFALEVLQKPHFYRNRFLQIVGLGFVDFLVLGKPSGNKMLLPDIVFEWKVLQKQHFYRPFFKDCGVECSRFFGVG